MYVCMYVLLYPLKIVGFFLLRFIVVMEHIDFFLLLSVYKKIVGRFYLEGIFWGWLCGYEYNKV